MNFTTQLNTTPRTALAPSTEELPSAFVTAMMGASRNSQGLRLGRRNWSHPHCHHQLLGRPAIRKEIKAATSSLNLKITVLVADIADLLFAKLFTDIIASSNDRLDLVGQETRTFYNEKQYAHSCLER